MWAVVLSALRARRGQTVVVAMVALLACAAAAGAPWYGVAVTHDVAVAAVAGAPEEERLVAFSRSATAGPVRLGPEWDLPWAAEVPGVRLDASVANLEGDSTQVSYAHREGVCDRVVVDGDCPAEAGELLLPRSLLEDFGLSIGDEVVIVASFSVREPARVAGSYEVVDPAADYWADGALVGRSTETTREAIFTAAETIAGFERTVATYDLVAAPDTLAGMPVEAVERQLLAGSEELRAQGFTVTSGLQALVERIERERDYVIVGFGAGLAILVLLSWFTLVVVERGTAVQLRNDIGWWKLRGAPPGRGWLLALGQSAVPLLAGGLLGGGAGVALGRWWGGALDRDDSRIALTLTVGLVLLTLVGAIVAAAAAQVGTVRSPVRALLRRIPPRQRRWRRSLVDLVLLALAGVAVGQALWSRDTGPGLAQLAPALAALAVAVAAAWAVPALVATVAARALRAGRVAPALIAASMARRAGAGRLFALVAVAVALLTVGLVGVDSTARTQQARAALETGAERVVTVGAVDAAELLATVRSVDPAGTQAMAVVATPGSGSQPPTLAVDSTRLAAVVPWREEYGGPAERVAAALRPPVPEPVTFVASELTAVVAGRDAARGAIHLRLLLQQEATGAHLAGETGELSRRPSEQVVAVPECAQPPGCRLVGMELLGQVRPGGYASPGTDAWVEVAGLAAGDTGIAVEQLADPTRWRTGHGLRELGPLVTAGPGGLRLTVPLPPPRPLPMSPEWMTRSGQVFLVDTPLRLPAVSAGWRPSRPSAGDARLSPVARAEVPAEPVRAAALVPVFGAQGAIVDLATAHRLAPYSEPAGTAQVWLSPTAPESIVDDLVAAGLRPLQTETTAGAAARWEQAGAPVAGRFQAVVGGVGLLLAAGALLVLAAQDRATVAREMSALRAQGVSARAVRLVSWGGPAAVAVTGSFVGLGAAAVGVAIARRLDAGFADGWTLLPLAAPQLFPVGLAVVAAAAVLGAAVLVAARRLVRQTEAGAA